MQAVIRQTAIVLEMIKFQHTVFALPFAALLERIKQYKWRPLVYLVAIYLIGVNIFQVWQYNKGIIGDMTYRSYKAVYLDFTSFVK